MFHNPYSGRVVREFKFEQYSLSVNSVKLSHNGKYLAARQPQLPNVDIWDLELEKKTAVLKGHEKEIVAMCLNPSGEKLATSSRDGTVRIWETATEKLIKTIMVDVPPEVIAFAPDGKRIAMGGLRGGVISVREADSWDEIALLKPELGYTRVLAFHPDGSRLAAATGRFVHVWQISDKPK
jgi:WD40 repeat protein